MIVTYSPRQLRKHFELSPESNAAIERLQEVGWSFVLLVRDDADIAESLTADARIMRRGRRRYRFEAGKHYSEDETLEVDTTFSDSLNEAIADLEAATVRAMRMMRNRAADALARPEGG